MRGCRKVISIREAQMGVCDEHALPIWSHIQRYKNEPDVIDAAVALYERKVRHELWADEEVRLRTNPKAQDIGRFYERYVKPIDDEVAAEQGGYADDEKYEDIYYVAVGDLIKIGYSSNLESRLLAYGPTARVLAHHPGSRADERDLHRSFRPFLAHGREWYKPAQIILDHITAVIEKHGEPWCIPEWSAPKEAAHALRRSSQAKPTGLSL